MPPKSAVLLKELREKAPQEAAAAVVEKWATSIIPEAEQLAKAAQEVQFPEDRTAPPPSVLSILDALRLLQVSVVSDIQVLRSSIVVRVPEMKEEDNLGVSVQVSALKVLDEVEKAQLDSEKGTLATVQYKASYLGSRASIEEKLNPTGKDAQPSKSASLLLQLHQVDSDAALIVFLTALKIAASLRALVTLYIENAKKLANPRVSNDRMIS